MLLRVGKGNNPTCWIPTHLIRFFADVPGRRSELAALAAKRDAKPCSLSSDLFSLQGLMYLAALLRAMKDQRMELQRQADGAHLQATQARQHADGAQAALRILVACNEHDKRALIDLQSKCD
ncbi:unnamed protein product [Cuscuta epithymum]|uniref:Uncharacterized protein n=1 Tax=Cuscuta epithymum TaxID=186058 RepID=A0AAV0FU77_9ASTE|nr:unnamed protein product [Cuscuta epithymum]